MLQDTSKLGVVSAGKFRKGKKVGNAPYTQSGFRYSDRVYKAYEVCRTNVQSWFFFFAVLLSAGKISPLFAC